MGRRMTRAPGWEDRLALVIESYRHRPFGWGVTDCLTLTIDVVQALRGRDDFADWRGIYSTPEQALAIAATRGQQMVEEYHVRFGAPSPLSIMKAGRGDIALIDIGDCHFQFCAGVIWGGYIQTPGDSGLSRISLKRADRWWKV